MLYLVMQTYRDFPLFRGGYRTLEEAFFDGVVGAWATGINDPIVMKPTMEYPFSNSVSLEETELWEEPSTWKPTPFKAWTTGPDHLNHWYIVPLFSMEDRLVLAREATQRAVEFRARLRKEFSEELVFNPVEA
jgi:hypothetical protein